MEPENQQVTELPKEATVVSETPVEAPVAAEQAPAKKKKNPVVTILLVLVGLAVLCCACTAGGIAAVMYGVQKSPQAVAVKSVYTALNEGDQETVKNLTSTTLYNDLFTPYQDGTTIASLFKGHIEKTTVISLNVDNDTAKVVYKLTTNGGVNGISSFTYAELKKNDNIWVVTYLGKPTTDSTSTATPTPTEIDY